MLIWDETKRKLNIKNHGFDVVGCDAIWDHFTVTREDKREDSVRFVWCVSAFCTVRWLCWFTPSAPVERT